MTVSKGSQGKWTLKVRIPPSSLCAGGQIFPVRQPSVGGAQSRKAGPESLAGHRGQVASRGALSKGTCHWNSGMSKYVLFVAKVIQPVELLIQLGLFGAVAQTVEE